MTVCSAAYQLSNRPYDVLRIDFRDPALPLPEDGFNDEWVSRDPQVVASQSVTK